MNTLYLLTGQYPYSQYVECFLEDEIEYLSKTFERVVIVPTRGAETKRPTPSNCVTTEPIFPSKVVFLLKGLFNKRTFITLMSDFFRNKVFASKNKFGVWIKGVLVINNLMNSKQIKQIETELDPSDVCYYYWGKWSNLLALFLEQDCHHVSRFHGAWDLWEEEFDNYAPLRYELADKLDKSVFISRMGQDFFTNKYPAADTSFNPLGSAEYGAKPTKTDSIVRIASCSTVYPLKRVDLIFQSVLLYAKNNKDKQVEWTHMGGGPSFDELKALVAANPLDNLTTKLAGNLDHSQVIKYYQKNSYDAFINLSTNEGVPVSIMEAISFDVPVVATAVGGTPEIVTEKSGRLVPSTPTADDVAQAISYVLNTDLNPRGYWLTSYSADKNYTDFANLLMSISKSNK